MRTERSVPAPGSGSVAIRRAVVGCIAGALFALPAAGPAPGQEAVVELASAECRECAVRLAHALRIGDATGPGRIEWTDVIVRRGDGDFVLHPGFDPGFLYVFDARGTFRRRIGREGQGPEELLTIQELVPWGRSGLIAFDARNQRASILDGEGNVARTIPLRGLLPPQTGVVVFPDDSLFVVNRPVRTTDRPGDPLHLVDDRGRIRRSFGAPPDATDDTDPGTRRRRLAATPDGRVWSASLRRWAVDLWTRDGMLVKSYRRSAGWFVVEDPTVRLSPEGGRFSEVMDIDFDAGPAYLWVLIQVPSVDADWAEGLISERYGGRTEYGPGDYDKLYDTMIEVVDVAADRLMASARVDPALRRFVALGLVTSFGRDPETEADVVDVWRVRVTGTGEEAGSGRRH